MGGYAAVFAVAALVTFVLVPIACRLSFRWGVLATPGGRRVHRVPTPLLGGSAMFVGFVVALGVASRIPQFKAVFSSSSEPLGVLCGAFVIWAVGTADDVIEVSPPAKLAGQVLAGSALYLLGVAMYYFRLPFRDILVLSPDLVAVLTVVWVVGMANAINLIDGLDGLAAGIVAIGAGTFFLYGDRLFKAGLIPGDNMGPLVAAITCGLCVGFLPWNFSPAKIFMGDSGAMLLGLLMAASTMVVGGRVSEPFTGQTYFFLAPLFIPFVILAVPFIDTILAIVRRTVKRTGVHIADREHLHHRLLELGHGPRRAVVILWSCTAIFSGFVLVPTFFSTWLAFLPLVAALLATAAFTLLHTDPHHDGRARRRPKRRARTRAAGRPVAPGAPQPSGGAGPVAASPDDTGLVVRPPSA